MDITCTDIENCFVIKISKTIIIKFDEIFRIFSRREDCFRGKYSEDIKGFAEIFISYKIDLFIELDVLEKLLLENSKIYPHQIVCLQRIINYFTEIEKTIYEIYKLCNISTTPLRHITSLLKSTQSELNNHRRRIYELKNTLNIEDISEYQGMIDNIKEKLNLLEILLCKKIKNLC